MNPAARAKTHPMADLDSISTSPADWPVTVHKMGRSIFDPVWAEQEHADRRSELIHVLKGRVRIETPGYTIAGSVGDTLYTPAGTPHKDVFPRGTIFEVYLIQFSWTEEPTMLGRYHPRELARASRAARPMFASAFDQLYREFTTELAFQQPMVALRTGQILYELCRAAAMRRREADESPQRIAGDRRRQIMDAARKLIDERLDGPISLDELAAAIDVSPYYLSRVFSQESGFTLSSYVTRRRMEKAQAMLAAGERSIKEIAYAVGYRDSHYFSRVFRSQFHVAPSAYRRQVRSG